MDKKLKMKWVKALESGKYKQGKSYLQMDGHFCCLGVLRDIEPSIQRQDNCENLEPDSCGILEEQLELLIQQNDAQDKSFKEIAKWILANL